MDEQTTMEALICIDISSQIWAGIRANSDHISVTALRVRRTKRYSAIE
jgi:hypothetical protein